MSQKEKAYRLTFKEETTFTVYVKAPNRRIAQKWATDNIGRACDKCRNCYESAHERYCEDCALEAYDPGVMKPDIILDAEGKEK